MNDFSFIADSFNTMVDSIDMWLKSGSGGIACYGYKYAEGSRINSANNPGDYIEFAFHQYETTGSPITGVCFKTTQSGSSTASSISADNFTGYAVLNSLVTSELLFCYYKNQSLVTLPPTGQILAVVPNSWMLTVPAGAVHGMAMNVFAFLPVSAQTGVDWWDVTVNVGSRASKQAFRIRDNVANSAWNFAVWSAIPWGARINDPSSAEFRFGEHRFDNSNFGLVVVGNSAAGVHAARWASNSGAVNNTTEQDYGLISSVI